ncbi:PAS domain S-box protein [Fulvivirga lutea]|uniref:PAS domain S-box protein n=1 Tax=Fulvivirga lutea TaxID=2810512 RepID=A0A975A183_9BACT|nr:PAS domain S-box protein [Fulvivirga lutea]QSE97586.1 PAS domain S-box protein [Fulvivirga lutea]
MANLAAHNHLVKYKSLLENIIDKNDAILVMDDSERLLFISKSAQKVLNQYTIDIPEVGGQVNFEALKKTIDSRYVCDENKISVDDAKLSIVRIKPLNDLKAFDLYKSVADQSRDAIVITDANLSNGGPRIEYVNQAYLDLTGYELKEVLGKSPKIMQGPKTERKVLDRLKENLENNEPFFGQTYNYRKDGSEFINEWKITPIVSAEGQVIKYLATIRDVTERELAKDKLQRNELRLSSIIESSERSLLMYDTEFIIRSFNKKFAERYYLEQKLKVIEGKTLDTFLDEEQLHFIKQNTERAFKGKIVQVEAINTLFKDDQYYDFSFNPIKGNNGIVGFILTFRNIDKEKRAALSIEINERKYRTIVDSLGEGIVLQNKRGEIIEFNNSALTILGLTSDQLLGRNSYDPKWRAIDTEGNDFPGGEHPISKSLSEGVSIDRFIMGIHKPAGQLTWLSVNSRPITNEKGEVIQAVASVNDITEEYHLKLESEASSKRFQALFQNNPMPMLVVEHQFERKIHDANEAMIKKYGFSRNEVLELSLDDLVEDKTASVQYTNALNLAKNKASTFQLHRTKKSGNLIVEVISHELNFHDRKYSLYILNDKTAELLYELELSESNKRYKHLFDKNPNSLFVVSKKEGQIKKVNEGARHYYGYDQSEMQAKRFIDLFSKDSINKINTIKDLDTVDTSTDFIHSTKSKSDFYVNLSISDIIDEGEECYLIQVRDITKRKLAENKLKHTETQLASLVKNNPVSVWSTDNAGKITFCIGSLFESVGIESDELIGQEITTGKGLIKFSEAEINKVKQGNEIEGIFHFDGHYIKSCISPLLGNNGETLGLIGVSTDVTKMMLTHQQLEKTGKLLEMTQELGRIGGWRLLLKEGVLEWSSMTKKIHGESEEFKPNVKNAIHYYSKDDRPVIENAVNNLIEKGVPYDLELRLKPKKNNPIWVRTQGRRRTENGEPVEIYGTIQDITESKLARQKQDEFARIYGLSSELASVTTFDGKFEYLNPAWEKTLGYSLRHLTNNPFFDFIHPDDIEHTNKEFKKLLSGKLETLTNFRNRYRTSKGAYRWFTWSSTVDLKRRRIYSVAIDITEQVNLENELVRKERFFRKLVIKGFGSSIILNKTGVVTYVGGSGINTFGHSSDTLYGKKLTSIIHTSDLKKFREDLELSAQHESQNVRDQVRVMNAKGDVKWAEINITNELNDPDVKGLVVNLHDITETVEAHSRTVQSEHRYKMLVDKSPMPIVIHSEGIIRFVNDAAARTMEGKPEHLIGKKVQKFVADKLKKEVSDRIDSLYKQKTNHTGVQNSIFKTLKGREIYVELLGSSINYEGKNAVQLMFLDVSDKVEAAIAIRESEQRYRNLVNNSPMPILIVVNDKIVFLNYSAANSLGGDVLEFINQPLENVIANKGNSNVVHELKKYHKKSVLPSELIELTFKRKNNTLLYAEVLAASTEYMGEPAVQIMYLDITEKKQLLTEQLKLKGIVTESFEEIYIFNSKTLKFTFANNSALKHTGYSFQEITKMNPYDLRPDYDSNNRLKLLLKEAREKLKPIEFNGFNKRKDNSVYRVAVRLQFLKVGEEEVYVSTVNDITEQHKLELRRDLINNINEAIVRRDVTKDILTDLIGMIAESLDFDLGEIWRIEEDKYIRQAYSKTYLNEIKKIIEVNKSIEFKIGEGVVGGCYEKQEVIWLTKFEKGKVKMHKLHVNLGIKTVVAFPLIVDEESLGVAKLYSTKHLPYDEDTAELLMTLGTQLAQFKKRKNVEIQLLKSLEEKEGLLQEIHHRVKNNLQTVSSLLYLRSSSIEDAEVKRFFTESQNRIKAITFTHERLLRAKSYTELDIKYYLDDLIDNIYQTHISGVRIIELQKDIESHILPTDVVMNCGLIINELLTNAFDHAFKPDENGTIKVSLKQKGEKLQLIVHDSGVGFDYANKYDDSVGVQLVHLFTDQLKGSFKVKTTNGTKVEITFSHGKV